MEKVHFWKIYHYGTESIALSMFPVLKNFNIVNLQLLGYIYWKQLVESILNGFINTIFSCQKNIIDAIITQRDEKQEIKNNSKIISSQR